MTTRRAVSSRDGDGPDRVRLGGPTAGDVRALFVDLLVEGTAPALRALRLPGRAGVTAPSRPQVGRGGVFTLSPTAQRRSVAGRPRRSASWAQSEPPPPPGGLGTCSATPRPRASGSPQNRQ